MSDVGMPDKGFDWEGSPDLTVLSEGDLKDLLEALAAEERELSYRRRVVQGRIDLIRGELVRRGGFELSPEELARALMDRPGKSSGEEGSGEEGGA